VNNEQPEGILETLEEKKTSVDLPFKVILYNDNVHSFDEVIAQLIKALGCSFTKARSLAYEAHVKGKSTIFFGDLTACLKVSSILEEIALHTQILSE